MARMPKGRGMTPHPEQGAVIRWCRTAMNLSLTDLAAKLGVTRRYVVMLQAGQRCASGKLARRFQELSQVALPMPRVLPTVLGKASRKALLADEAVQNAELERRWPAVTTYRPPSFADWRARRRF